MIVVANMAAPTLLDYLHFLNFFTDVSTFSTGETGTMRMQTGSTSNHICQIFFVLAAGGIG
jgi:hypothetical protein